MPYHARFVILVILAAGCASTREKGDPHHPTGEPFLPSPAVDHREVPYRPHEALVTEDDFIQANYGGDDQFLDAGRTLYLQEYRARDAVYQHLAVFDTSGALLDSLPNLRGHRIYLQDLLGDDEKEIIVSSIEGNDMSFLPVTWSIYTLSPGRKLRKVLEHPKAYIYYDGSCKGCEFVCYIFRFHCDTKGFLRVETMHFVEECLANADILPDLDVPRSWSEHDVLHFRYDDAAGEYTAATRADLPEVEPGSR